MKNSKRERDVSSANFWFNLTLFSFPYSTPCSQISHKSLLLFFSPPPPGPASSPGDSSSLHSSRTVGRNKSRLAASRVTTNQATNLRPLLPRRTYLPPFPFSHDRGRKRKERVALKPEKIFCRGGEGRRRKKGSWCCVALAAIPCCFSRP